MSVPPPALPRTIDHRYEVRGVLGEGGTGIVYDAIAPDGSDVAVKVMHAALAGDQQIRGRFQREAAILRRLHGVHVCPIVDFGETEDELLFLVLPRIDGPSLAAILAQGKLPTERVLDLVVQVLEGLSSAHDEGIIHRDLKPTNVLLEKARDIAVVVDFGLSKIIVGGGAGTTNLTKHNMLFGTPEYMSPEQARGDELDVRTDIYAAGVMLYEMLTGAPPFTGETPLNVLTAHLTSDIVPPSQRTPLSAALEATVLHALARDRERRYPSAAAFRAAIRQARLRPDDAAAVAPAAIAAADAFGATMPASAPTPPPPLDVNAATLVAITPSSPPASRPPRSVRPPPKRPAVAPPESNRMWILLWIIVGLASIATGVYIALRS